MRQRHGNHMKQHNTQQRTVNDVKVLIIKSTSVDRLSSSSIEVGEIPALTHESWDDAVENASLVPEPILPSTQLLEIGDSLGNDISVQSKLYASKSFSIDGYVEVHSVGNIS